MEQMVKLALPAALLALAAPATGAFEQAFGSPWLGGGAAASLFARSPLFASHNPASAALMDSPGVAASAARPFGLAPLDRMAVAGCGRPAGVPLAGCFDLSGNGECSEASLGLSGAFPAAPGVVAGLGAHLRRLQITGYGTGMGASADLGVVYSPLAGVYGGAAVRGLLRTGLGESGDPACPRRIDLALGLCPAEGVTAAVGYRSAEHLPAELSVHSTYAPAEALSVFAGVQTGPTRFTVGLAVSLGPGEVSYAVCQHAELPATHSAALCWGGCAFRPRPLSLGGEEAGEGSEGDHVDFPVNVNTATSAQLQAVPGIGPAKAGSILAWIRDHGPFESLEDLLQVPGIGPATVEGFRGYLVAE
jgi:competence protein ComEA